MDIPGRRSRLPIPADELSKILRSANAIVPPSKEDLSKFKTAANGDITMYEGLIEQIRGKISLIQRDISYIESLRSPIRRLPSEVLRQIFLFASDWNRFGFQGEWVSFTFQVAAVCSRWREIAIATPELWSMLSLCLCDRAVEVAKLAVTRSKNHPLSLELGDEFDNSNMTILPLLYEHRERWKHVHMERLHDGEVCSALTYPASLPLLESATVEGLVGNWSSQHLDASPQLRHFKLSAAIETLTRENHEGFDLSRIHHLDMSFDEQKTIQSELNVLKNAQNLRSFRFHGDAMLGDGSGFSYQRTIENTQEAGLTHITSPITFLSLDFCGGQGVANLLNDVFLILTLPSLETLEIHGRLPPSWLRWEWPHYAITSCILRSECNLTSLSLLGMPIQDTYIIRLLRLTPALQRLTIHEIYAGRENTEEIKRLTKTVTTKLLEELTVTSEKHPFVPKLKYLEFRVQTHFDSDLTFVMMVLSRWSLTSLELWPEVERLRTVTLVIVDGKEVKKGVYEPLKKLDRAGMMASVLADGVYVV